MKYKKTFFVLMLIFMGVLFYFRSNEESSERFQIVKSQFIGNQEFIDELGAIEDVDLISFKYGATGNQSNIMYKVGVTGSKKEQILFVYLSICRMQMEIGK